MVVGAGHAVAAVTPVPHEAVFSRWFVACDNARRCEARGVSEAAQIDLRLTRDAGPAGPTLTLTTDLPMPKAVRIGAESYNFGPAWTRSAAGSTGDNALSTTDPAEIARVITLARTAPTLNLGGGVSVPLDGMMAALLRVDDVQNRIGTATALVGARGSRGVDDAPGLPGAPVWIRPKPLPDPAAVAKATRTAAAATLKANGCTVDPADEAYALDDTHAVVVLDCEHYAYQSSSLIMIASRQGGPAVPFAPELPTVKQRSAVWTEGSYNPDPGVLGMSAKGRGLADCGFSASWIWSAGAFRLSSMNAQPLCGGAQPGDWPALYRTR